MNSTKYCIIGGSGFVGSRLIQSLSEKYCLNLDKNPSPFFDSITIKGDIRQLNEINIPKQTKSVILLAAEHRDDVHPTSLYYDVNVEGTKNVLQKMDEKGVKNLIFTSSVAVYGLNKTNPSEKHEIDPFNHYGESKWEAERVIKEWFEKDPQEKSVSVIRPSVIFGERNRGNVYNLLKQMSSGRFLIIGKGQNKKSMAYVGNVVEFIKSRLEASEPGFQIFNYADKPDYTMTELTEIIENKMNISIPKTRIPYWLGMLGGYGFDLLAKATGEKKIISSVRVKKFCATTQVDATKCHEIFKAPFTLKEGLNRTLEFEFFNPNKDDILFYSE